MVWDKDEMDSTIREYSEENGELDKKALNDPETDTPCYTTVRMHYGGIQDCVEELELDVEVDSRGANQKFSRNDVIDAIREESEDGIASNQPDFTDARMSKGPIKRLFGSYTNAVFMAGKEPIKGWHRQDKDRSEEILADYLQTTRENYWHNDPDDRWNTEPIGNADYLNPIVSDLPFSYASLEEFNDGFKQPDMRFNHGPKGDIKVQTQNQIMDIVINSENYLDIVSGIKDKDITEGQVKSLLDPESDNSYGRWMAEDEFPENTLAMLKPGF